MKCPNCGAEMGNKDKFCPACGSQITYAMQKEQEQLNKQGCPQCGSSNIKFKREKQGEYRGKRTNRVVYKTVGFCQDCGHTWFPEGPSAPQKSSNTWLWVLGWIFIFPVPVTILLIRQKKMHPALKYGIIAVAWIVYLIIAFSGKPSTSKTSSANKSDVEESGTTAKEETAVDVKEESAESKATTESEIMDVTLEVNPNVNADDGTVLFGVATNLPEKTELMVTVSNDSGYTAQDTAVVLADGNGYTAEFSDNGAGLKGDYNVSVTMSLPSLQPESVQEVIGKKGEKIGGQYVEKSDTGDSNVVAGDFSFTF